MGFMWDNFVNFVNGLGTTKDPSSQYLHQFVPIDDSQLESAYRGDWVSRKIVNAPAWDAMAKWRRWQANKPDIETIENVERAMDLQRKLKRAMIRARLWGGAALVLGVKNSGQPSEELNLDAVKKDSLEYIHVMSRRELRADTRITDPTDPYFGQPKSYEALTGETFSPGQNIIHPSRVVQLLGDELPDFKMTAATGNNWGADSVLQAVNDAVKGIGVVAGGVSALVGDMKFDVVSIPGLTSQISDAAYKKRLTDRLLASAEAKGLVNSVLMDKEETWQRIQTNLTGMPDIVKVFLLLVAGAADMPLSRLVGPGQHGLGGAASGESDLVNYYDAITVQQETVIGPSMRQADEVIVRSALGRADPSIYYEWPPLLEMSDKDKAAIALQKSQTTTAYINMGLINEEAMRKGVVNQLIEDQTYPGLDQAIDELGDEPAQPDGQFDPATGQPLIGTVAEAAFKAMSNKQLPPPVQPKLLPKPAVGDAAPRSLYVYRQVTNASAIKAWAKKQGFTSTVPAGEMHVTVMFSRSPVDWAKTGSAWGSSPGGGDDDGTARVPPGGMRMVDQFNGGAVVLQFNSSALSWRHEDLKRAGAAFDFQDYQPHITLTYQAPDGLDLRAIEPYRGAIELGPEVYEEVKDGWKNTITEDAAFRMSIGDAFDPNEERDDRGRWSGSGSGTSESAHPTHPLPNDNRSGEAVYDMPDSDEPGSDVTVMITRRSDGSYRADIDNRYDEDIGSNPAKARAWLKKNKAKYAGWENARDAADAKPKAVVRARKRKKKTE